MIEIVIIETSAKYLVNLETPEANVDRACTLGAAVVAC
jgi:hypothetical protein